MSNIAMVELYVKTGCPFCRKVKEAVAEMGIESKVEYKNIAEEENRNTVIERGGEAQYPFMIDEEQDVTTYESDNIIEHLKTYYAE